MPTALTPAPRDVRVQDRAVVIEWADECLCVLPFAWLRDNCSCPSCRHASGQRLLEPVAIPPDLHPIEVRLETDRLLVTWAPEGHLSTYPGEWLRGSAVAPVRTLQLWDAAIATALPLVDGAGVVRDPRVLRRWLEFVDRLGFALLSGVPVRDGEVARVAELFGHVRVTNYGRIFEVRAVVAPTNLAYTSRGLGPHTDNPYRDPVPSLQLLHCLSSSAEGGESTLVDGFRVAEALRADHPADFARLAGLNVGFAYADAGAELRANVPMIELDPRGPVRSVRFNPRSLRTDAIPQSERGEWYDAYLRFSRMLADERFEIRLRLAPGDLLIVDNRRVLHGRTPYAKSAGERHLQGCYADIDGLRSTLGVLDRGSAHG